MKQYIVDAFTQEVFKGNPAAVCVLDEFPPDELLLSITKENNLSETAFAVKISDQHYQLRWFTPGGEIDLCGHATLATAFVLHHFYEATNGPLNFTTMSGELTVTVKGELYEMVFPSYQLQQIPVTEAMREALGIWPVEAYKARDLVCVLENEAQVRALQVDFNKIAELDGLLVHATAQGSAFDCISRSFAPKLGINEDPVCGSGHCHIVPLWSNKLKQTEIKAYQASERSGILSCTYEGETTRLAGYATLFSTAVIFPEQANQKAER